MPIPFVGPSYQLRSRPADVQRTIGMYAVPIEPQNGRNLYVFKDVPGKVVFATLGGQARGAKNVNGRAFVVFGATLYEVSSSGATTARGTLGSTTGFVGMAFNTLQLCIADANSLYVLTLATNEWKWIPDFPGTGRLEYLNQYILFRWRDSQQFGWTPIGDASTLDALNFASAESSPDKLVGIVVDHREALLIGADSAESWLNTGSDSVFERNNGVSIEEGGASEWTIAKMDNSVYWLSSSSRGQGAVIKLQGYQPVRVSTQAIEEKLQGVDLSGASAYTYEDEKNSFYVLNVPALDTSLVYNAFSGLWHEWAEYTNGVLQKDRGRVHLYAFGKHLIGADDGKLYALDPNAYTNDGATLLRERTTPDSAVPNRQRIPYGTFELDCERGTAGQVQLRVSNDGGATWGAWRTRSLGAVGVYGPRVKWSRCGSAKDRVTQVRCTDPVPFNPVSAGYF